MKAHEEDMKGQKTHMNTKNNTAKEVKHSKEELEKNREGKDASVKILSYQDDDSSRVPTSYSLCLQDVSP